MSAFFSKITEFRENLFRNREPLEADQEPEAVNSPVAEKEIDDSPSSYPELLDDIDDLPEPDEISFEDGRREYSGMPGNYQVVIRPVYDHFFLSRKYGTHGKPSIKMSWRFNEYGRIDLVDARLLPEKDVHHLMKVRHFEQLSEPWDEAISFHYELPERVSLLNPGFRNLRYPRKYQSILRFGHSMARDVILALESGAVRDSYVLGEQQEQLRDMVKDEAALVLLKQASQLMPSSKMLNKTVMKIFYDNAQE